MASKLKKTDRQKIRVTYTVKPAFIATVDLDRMQAFSGMGKTAREAINHLRTEVKRRYPDASYEVTEKASNVELWTATGWENPTYD